MTFFATPAEVDFLVGGALRWAASDPATSARLGQASITVGIVCRDPWARIVVEMYHPVRVTWDDAGLPADVELSCEGDVLDRWMRGGQRLVDALALGEVIAKGRVSTLLKVVPVLECAFPVYREMTGTFRRDGIPPFPRTPSRPAMSVTPTASNY